MNRRGRALALAGSPFDQRFSIDVEVPEAEGEYAVQASCAYDDEVDAGGGAGAADIVTVGYATSVVVVAAPTPPTTPTTAAPSPAAPTPDLAAPPAVAPAARAVSAQPRYTG